MSQAPVREVLVGEGLEGLHDRLDLTCFSVKVPAKYL